MPKSSPPCAAAGCANPADVEVLLYDLYLDEHIVFSEQDRTCPYLCYEHMAANERGAVGVRGPGEDISYPYTNQEQAGGFTIYRPLRTS